MAKKTVGDGKLGSEDELKANLSKILWKYLKKIEKEHLN